MRGEELAAENWARSAEELRGCGHCVELQEKDGVKLVRRRSEIGDGRVIEFPFFDDTEAMVKEIPWKPGRN